MQGGRGSPVSKIVPYRKNWRNDFGSCALCLNEEGFENKGGCPWLYCEKHKPQWVRDLGPSAAEPLTDTEVPWFLRPQP